MCTTLIALISSGERRPNWISLIVRKGHLDCICAPGAMIATVEGRRESVFIVINRLPAWGEGQSRRGEGGPGGHAYTGAV